MMLRREEEKLKCGSEKWENWMKRRDYVCVYMCENVDRVAPKARGVQKKKKKERSRVKGLVELVKQFLLFILFCGEWAAVTSSLFRVLRATNGRPTVPIRAWQILLYL